MKEKKERILIVDDEPDIVDTLKHFILTRGYDVISAFSGEEALEILNKERVDLVLLDFMLPGIKGDEVARIIKEKYPSIKLIVITGYPEESEALAGSKNTFEGLLIKPLGVKELYKKILDVLHQDESNTFELKSNERITARILLIKARLLFLESSPDIWNFLKGCFLKLSNKGETYEMDCAKNSAEYIDKLKQFKPDIGVINMSCFSSMGKEFIQNVLPARLDPNEIIIYKVPVSGVIEAKELERLSRAVQAICLKNGLIEFKWVNI